MALGYNITDETTYVKVEIIQSEIFDSFVREGKTIMNFPKNDTVVSMLVNDVSTISFDKDLFKFKNNQTELIFKFSDVLSPVIGSPEDLLTELSTYFNVDSSGGGGAGASETTLSDVKDNQTNGNQITDLKKSNDGVVSIIPTPTTGIPFVIAPENLNRLQLSIWNNTNRTLIVLLMDDTPTNSFYSFKLNSNSYYELPIQYTGIINGLIISAGVITGTILVTEI